MEENYDLTIIVHGTFPELRSTHVSAFGTPSTKSHDFKAYTLEEALFDLMNADFKEGSLPFPSKAKTYYLTSFPNMTWKDAGIAHEDIA